MRHIKVLSAFSSFSFLSAGVRRFFVFMVCSLKVSQIFTNLRVSLVNHLTHIPLPTPALGTFPSPRQRNMRRLSKSSSFPTTLNSFTTERFVWACWAWTRRLEGVLTNVGNLEGPEGISFSSFPTSISAYFSIASSPAVIPQTERCTGQKYSWKWMPLVGCSKASLCINITCQGAVFHGSYSKHVYDILIHFFVTGLICRTCRSVKVRRNEKGELTLPFFPTLCVFSTLVCSLGICLYFFFILMLKLL